MHSVLSQTPQQCKLKSDRWLWTHSLAPVLGVQQDSLKAQTNAYTSDKGQAGRGFETWAGSQEPKFIWILWRGCPSLLIGGLHSKPPWCSWEPAFVAGPQLRSPHALLMLCYCPSWRFSSGNKKVNLRNHSSWFKLLKSRQSTGDKRPTFLGGVDLPDSRSKSKYSTCLSPFGFTIGLLPPSVGMGAAGFIICESQHMVYSLRPPFIKQRKTNLYPNEQICCHNNQNSFKFILNVGR